MHLFCYGTLRHDPDLERIAANTVHDCTTTGTMANVHGEFPIFPVVDFDGDGPIVGDLYMALDESERLVLAVTQMELNAGYHLRYIDVRTPHGKLYRAFAYEKTTEGAGAPIPDGDWRRFVRDNPYRYRESAWAL